MRQTFGKSDRKPKKSFTLSPESIAFLEEMRKKNSAESVSATIEDLLQAMRHEEKRAQIDRETTDYYNARSSAEVSEEKLWAEFARRPFFTGDKE